MNETIGFHHGALSDSYEDQAKSQGYTFGDKADFVQRVGDGLIAAYVHGCITDSEYNRILHRFQEKVLIKMVKKMEEDNG